MCAHISQKTVKIYAYPHFKMTCLYFISQNPFPFAHNTRTILTACAYSCIQHRQCLYSLTFTTFIWTTLALLKSHRVSKFGVSTHCKSRPLHTHSAELQCALHLLQQYIFKPMKTVEQSYFPCWNFWECLMKWSWILAAMYAAVLLFSDIFSAYDVHSYTAQPHK